MSYIAVVATPFTLLPAPNSVKQKEPISSKFQALFIYYSCFSEPKLIIDLVYNPICTPNNLVAAAGFQLFKF